MGSREDSPDVVCSWAIQKYSCVGRAAAEDTVGDDLLAAALHGPRLVLLHAPLEVARHSPSSFQDGETAKERDIKKE